MKEVEGLLSGEPIDLCKDSRLVDTKYTLVVTVEDDNTNWNPKKNDERWDPKKKTLTKVRIFLKH